MNSKILKSVSEETIEDKILTIRGIQVMLDKDVANLFEINTKSLNQQMKRNINRFPEDFCFQLNSKELNSILRSQNVTSNSLSSKRRYKPYVYTEQGIIALSGVIKNDFAIDMSIKIVRAFISMRKFIIENGDILLKLAQLQNRQIDFEIKTNKRFEEVINSINKAELPKQVLFFNGQYFDAYDFIVLLIKKAKKSLLLMDPYCDNRALSLISNKNEVVQVTIYKSNKAKLNEDMVEAFIKEYGEIQIKNTELFHDRFLIVDNEECYFLGASINCAGKKAFAVNKAEKEIVDLLLNRFN